MIIFFAAFAKRKDPNKIHILIHYIYLYRRTTICQQIARGVEEELGGEGCAARGRRPHEFLISTVNSQKGLDTGVWRGSGKEKFYYCFEIDGQKERRELIPFSITRLTQLALNFRGLFVYFTFFLPFVLLSFL